MSIVIAPDREELSAVNAPTEVICEPASNFSPLGTSVLPGAVTNVMRDGASAPSKLDWLPALVSSALAATSMLPP